MTAPTLLDRRIGAAALAVTVAGVPVPGTALGAVSIRHGRRDPASRPEAASCSLTLDAGAVPLPALGDQLEVGLGDDALAAFGIPAGDQAAHRFVGTITDLRLVPSGRPGQGWSQLAVVATGRRAGLARIIVGDTPWPAEADGARAARILTLARATGIEQVDGSSTAGWGQAFFDYPVATGTVTPDGLRVDWPAAAGKPGTPACYVRFYAEPTLVTGKSYTAVCEVKVPPGCTPVEMEAPFRSAAEGATLTGADRWQTTTTTWVQPSGNVGAQVGLFTMAPTTGDPATDYCLIRSFSIWESDHPIVVDAIDPGTVEVLARDVDRQPALALLDHLAESSGSELVELRSGLLAWHQADRRRTTTPVLTLTAADVLAGAEWAQGIGDLVNDVTVVYGPPVAGADRASVRVVDQVSVDDRGQAALRIDTELAELADADAMANLVVGRRSRPVWALSGMRVELARRDDALPAALLGLRFGDLLEVTGFPSTAPASTARAWVEGWTETITPTSWRLELATSDYGQSGPPGRWADVPADLTWADLPAVSWLGATTWRPDDPGDGRWVDYPANLRWSDLDPATTWANATT